MVFVIDKFSRLKDQVCSTVTISKGSGGLGNGGSLRYVINFMVDLP